MGNFRSLNVWQHAIDVSVRVYALTRAKALSKDFGLRDQLQRSSVSIASNIAEGDELGTGRMSVRQFHVAKGSAAELITQLLIANKTGYTESKETDLLINECDKIIAMLNNLISARKKYF
jgi:four helix bundle protein